MPNNIAECFIQLLATKIPCTPDKNQNHNQILYNSDLQSFCLKYTRFAALAKNWLICHFGIFVSFLFLVFLGSSQSRNYFLM